MPTCQDLAKTSFSYENVFLQCSDSLSGAMSLTTSIARIAKVTQPKFLLNSQSFKDYGKPWNFFGGFAVCQYSWGRRLFIQEIESIGRTLWSRAVSQSVALPLFFCRKKRLFNTR